MNKWLTSGCVLLSSVTVVTARAESLDSLERLTQGQFKQLSGNVAAATHYKALAPAEPLGTLGFDIAIELSSTELDGALFDLASNGGFDIGSFLVPRLHVHKGLPFNLDLGASLTAIPGTDFRVVGAEIRYSLLEGSTLTPALAVRLTHSRIQGVDELDLNSTGLELSVSKGFANLTPYAGVGAVRTTSSPNVGGLSNASFTQRKLYVGLNINLGINFGLEADRTGDYSTYSVKAGFRF